MPFTLPSPLAAQLGALYGVDAAGLEHRAAKLATRSLKSNTKMTLIDLAISMIDLTTLEATDTPGRIRSLCAKAITPDSSSETNPPASESTRSRVPSVAAVCVYPDLVASCVDLLGASSVKVASVATAFPSGRTSLEIKLQDTALALAAGADEIDMVIDRGAFLSAKYDQVADEIAAVKELCGKITLKVILETGELSTYDNIRRASWLAMLAGADFIKTSTGKTPVGATHPSVLVMLEAVRDFAEIHGRVVGVKAAGSIRTSKDALKYLVLVNETAGSTWLTPNTFRFGASTLLNDLLAQRASHLLGHYNRPSRFSID